MWSGGLHFIVTVVSVTPSTARRVGGLVTAEASKEKAENGVTVKGLHLSCVNT